MTDQPIDRRRTLRRVWWRIVPLLALALLLNYLDKVNIGFAALQMNHDLGLSGMQFGAAAGLFAIGYALAALPSTLLLERVGARRWMSFIMVVWGSCSAATALVSSPLELLVARVVLGVAEAGFTPGVILYLTYWFPAGYRGRVLASSLLILPLSLVAGGPISSALLSCDGLWGLAGWKWLFLCEGLPTVVLAVVVFRVLPDGPSDAGWLSSGEKAHLWEWLAADVQSGGSTAGYVIGWRAVVSQRVMMLAAAYLGIATSGVGALIFFPLMIRSMGFSVRHTGVVAAVPALVAACMQPIWGLWTDRSVRRESVVVATCLALGVGLCGTAALLPSPWALVSLTVAFVGFFGSVVPFWTLPMSFLTSASAAAGIALINIAGNLGNFTGPMLLGWLSDVTGSYEAGICGLAVPAVVAAVIVVGQRAGRPCD